MQHEHADETAPHTTGRIIRWARLYNLLFARNPTGVHKEALRAAAPQPGEKTIDVGCGPGTIAILMANEVAPGGEAVGIDASLEMIDVARKKAKRERSTARFEPAAIESLPFADGYFDLATSTFMLHHLPEECRARAWPRSAECSGRAGAWSSPTSRRKAARSWATCFRCSGVRMASAHSRPWRQSCGQPGSSMSSRSRRSAKER